MRYSIVLADDHNLIRKSVASLLREEADFDVVGECANGREMLKLIAHLRPSVAIVDIVMPEMNGIETTRHIKDLSPATRVIILSNYTEETYVRAALEAGAVGYIVKSGEAHDLVQAIRDGAHGKLYLSAEVAAIARRVWHSHPFNMTAPRPLSPRERQVLQLIAEGRSSKEIAVRLGIGQATVKTHRDHIMEKIDIHDTAGMTRYAIRIGLVRVE